MNQDRSVFSVSELNNAVATLLEQEFAWIWVEGEISNLATPASGHIYFTLKDAGAQVRCAMFRGRNRDLKFRPENGDQIVVRGKVSLYQVRGDYQLIVDRMEQAGAGALQRKFEELKHKLAAEGLFSEDSKQAIPEIPACIGVITSRTGAAIRDVLSVIARRFPSVPVKLYPVPVQGEEAAPAICHALELAQQHGACDVLLLVRGGGSLEDLWSFNEESVARALFQCSIPVVSGVGHEVDITIVDFVADHRAATPTAAAERVTPDQQAWMQTLDGYHYRLEQLINARIARLAERLSWLRTRLSQQHPLTVLQRLRQRVQDIEQRLQLTMRYELRAANDQLQHLHTQLLARSPVNSVRNYRNRIESLQQQAQFLLASSLEKRRSRLSNLSSTLHAISPLKTLSRGYSITRKLDGQTLTDTDSVTPNERIQTRLHAGQLISRIEKIIKDEST
ncbi:MAG: exodeoxyribonuclease VII large subunit [Gammaproteobacteria bacterium]|jgi:exodeoxyribonuclease VII large subunit